MHRVMWVILGFFISCGIMKQVEQAKRFAKCEFHMTTIKNLELGGVNIQHVRKLKDLSLSKAARLTAALTEKTLPLSFDLNLEATNPNEQPAAMNKLEWRLFVDDKELVAGQLEDRIEVPSQASTEFPVAIDMDLKKVLGGESRDAFLNLAFNLVGEGDRPSHILLKIKPSVMVAGISIDYPGYFEVKAKVDADSMKKMRQG